MGNVILWNCNNAANQKWTIDGNKIIDVNAGKCLEVMGSNSVSNGANVDIWTCNGGANQHWAVLAGDCCPTVTGVTLACCPRAASDEEATVVVNPLKTIALIGFVGGGVTAAIILALLRFRRRVVAPSA